VGGLDVLEIQPGRGGDVALRPAILRVVVENGRVLLRQVVGDLVDREPAEPFLLLRPRGARDAAEKQDGESELDCDADHRSSVKGAEYNPHGFLGQARTGAAPLYSRPWSKLAFHPHVGDARVAEDLAEGPVAGLFVEAARVHLRPRRRLLRAAAPRLLLQDGDQSDAHALPP